jgi:histone H3/H4
MLHTIIRTYFKQIKGRHRISNASVNLLARFAIDAIFELVLKANLKRKEDGKLTLTVDNLIYAYKEDLNDDYLLSNVYYDEFMETLNIADSLDEYVHDIIFERITRKLIENNVKMMTKSSRIFIALYFKYLIIQTLEKAARYAKTMTINEEDIEKAIDN